MKILHTSDWHLGCSLHGIDRTDELLEQVERVCCIARENSVDVLLVAGDIFERPLPRQRLHEITLKLAGKLSPLIRDGVRVILLPGNHDFRDHFQMMKAVLELECGSTERVRVVAGYDHFEWDGVQFVALPYPEREALEKNDQLIAQEVDRSRRNYDLSAALSEVVRNVTARLDPAKPAVFATHILIKGVAAPSARELGYREDICLARESLPQNVSYIALGHIHQTHRIEHVIPCWYSGSFDRMDLGERRDNKSVLLVEIEDSGPAKVTPLPIEASRFDDLTISSSALESFAESYAERERTYVRITIECQPGDNLLQLRRRIKDLFPHCLGLPDFKGAFSSSAMTGVPANPENHAVTVSDYLEKHFADDPDLPELKRLAQILMQEVSNDAAATN